MLVREISANDRPLKKVSGGLEGDLNSDSSKEIEADVEDTISCISKRRELACVRSGGWTK